MIQHNAIMLEMTNIHQHESPDYLTVEANPNMDVNDGMLIAISI